MEAIYAIAMTLQNLGVLPYILSRWTRTSNEPEVSIEKPSTGWQVYDTVDGVPERFGVGSYL